MAKHLSVLVVVVAIRLVSEPEEGPVVGAGAVDPVLVSTRVLRQEIALRAAQLAVSWAQVLAVTESDWVHDVLSIIQLSDILEVQTLNFEVDH